MTGSRSTHKTRWPLVVLLAVFLAAVVLSGSPPTTPPAEAKGVVKTKPKDDSSAQKTADKKDEAIHEEPAPKQEPKQTSPPPSSPTPKQDRISSPRRDDSIFRRREERREALPSESTRASPGRRGEATPDVFGQIRKRSERRDPEYKFRRHYIDPFFYPYDHLFHSCYPYYDVGTVIIIQDDTWDDSRRRWKKPYEYVDPLPGSLEEALLDIEATWREEDPEFLMWHVHPTSNVAVHYRGRYSHSLTPRQIFKLTAEGLARTETTQFRFTSVDRHGFEARAKAVHRFIGPDGNRRTAYLTYFFEKVRGRWIVKRIDFSKTDYGAAKCFIATAAYGTPMNREVILLRQFRDQYLMTNALGRKLVDLYYRMSPPVAERISGSDTARAAVRTILWPVVQACKVLVGD